MLPLGEGLNQIKEVLTSLIVEKLGSLSRLLTYHLLLFSLLSVVVEGGLSSIFILLFIF